jgi:beta-glucanase (GH16 family)
LTGPFRALSIALSTRLCPATDVRDHSVAVQRSTLDLALPPTVQQVGGNNACIATRCSLVTKPCHAPTLVDGATQGIAGGRTDRVLPLGHASDTNKSAVWGENPTFNYPLIASLLTCRALRALPRQLLGSWLGKGIVVLALIVTVSASYTRAQSAFADNFSSGMLDTTRWACDTGSSPGNIAGANVATWDCAHMDFSQGVLDIKLTQVNVAGVTQSVGAELRSLARYTYGEYHIIMRTASTAVTPNGSGVSASGDDSSWFLYFTDSQGEADMPEVTGDDPTLLQYSSYLNGTTDPEYSTITLTGPEQGFHDYGLVWTPGQMQFLLDGEIVTTHVEMIPTIPLWIMASLWGTNSKNWGGVSSPGTTRHQYIQHISYTPLGAVTGPTGLTAIVN